MAAIQALLALAGVVLMGISAWKETPRTGRPSLWRLGLTLVVLAVTLPLIRAGLASL